jgi:hypothetical protein
LVFIQVFSHVLFNLVDHFKNLFLNSLIHISSTSLSLVFVTVKLLSFGWVMLPCFFIFLVILSWNLCI